LNNKRHLQLPRRTYFQCVLIWFPSNQYALTRNHREETTLLVLLNKQKGKIRKWLKWRMMKKINNSSTRLEERKL